MMICKQLLGVQKQITNIGVLLELGRVPLCIYAVKLAIKNRGKIKQGKTNVLLMASHRKSYRRKPNLDINYKGRFGNQ